ncbi:MAG: ABC transporter permease [Proteobacteria bacterium]|nr:ABC transporter permease [Pseudomonadota bacterium]
MASPAAQTRAAGAARASDSHGSDGVTAGGGRRQRRCRHHSRADGRARVDPGSRECSQGGDSDRDGRSARGEHQRQRAACRRRQLQGRATTLLGNPPFIITLGGMTIWRGATLILHDGAPISNFDPAYLWWGAGTIAYVPVPVILFALVVAVGYVVQRYTRYGRHVYAVVGNPEAARLNGVNVPMIVTSVYLMVGVLSGLAGFLQSARLGAAEATAGVSYELRVIASVVIGGASLSGGRGGVGGTVVGALLIGVLTNGLVIMHVSSYWQQVVIGMIIVAALSA